MIRLTPASLTGLSVLLFFHSIGAEEPVTDDTVVADTAPGSAALHIVMMPAQRAMKGPDPFRDTGPWAALIDASIVGAAIDGVLSYSRDEIDGRSFADVAGSFDFRQAMLEGVAELDTDVVKIADLHEYHFSGNKRATARWILKERNADYVLYFEPTYFIAPDLNQIRLVVEIDLYTRTETSKALKQVYQRKYEYLSQSRGDLFRPFREGEKEALIEAIESHFDRKAEQYPHNIKAYRKDRARALDELENRDVILPYMAISEGWPNDLFYTGLQTATDHVMRLIRADLQDVDASTPADVEYVTFNGLDLRGKAAEFAGYLVGTDDQNMIYRDKAGNAYSVP